METIKWDGNTVELYDDIENMPSGIYAKFNKYMLLESAIGSSFEDFTSKHLASLYPLIQNNKKEEAITQLNNLRQLFFQMVNEVSVEHMAFACLIYSINGKEIKDYSESNLKRIVNQIRDLGLTQGIVKKKHT